MRQTIWIIILVLVMGVLPAQAQDGLNLPSELYVLNNNGVVQRFGLGSEGVSQVTPDGEFVIDFQVAPDANWIAYRTQDGLFLLNLFDESNIVIQIEGSSAGLPLLRGIGETIAWSPDSSAIAYTTETGGRVHFFADATFVNVDTPNLFNLQWSPNGSFLAAEAEENVWWIFQRDVSSVLLRAAIPGANGGDWLRDNQFLYAPLNGGLTVLDLSVGNEQLQVLSNDAIYFEPSVARDGQIVAFTGQFTAATLAQIQIDSNFIGQAMIIGSSAVDLSNVQWTPGGFLLSAFEGGVLALVNPITSNGFTLPVSSVASFGWGPAYPPFVTNVPLATNGYFIANDLDSVQQVWVLPADGSIARTITPASLDVTEYAISPNGQRIAYVSNSILWSFVIGSEDTPTELAMLGINDNIMPAWSPDNSTIYYRDTQSVGSGIWRVSADSPAELFLPDEAETIYSNPKPALGVGALLVNRGDELVLADTTSGEVTALNFTGEANWQTGTTFIIEGAPVLAPTEYGLYLADANEPDAQPTLILPLLGNLQLLGYGVINGDTVRMLVKNQNPGIVRVLDIPIVGGQPIVIADAGNMVLPRLSADGNLIIGQRTPEGVLLVYDITANTTRQIDVNAPIIGFRFG